MKEFKGIWLIYREFNIIFDVARIKLAQTQRLHAAFPFLSLLYWASVAIIPSAVPNQISINNNGYDNIKQQQQQQLEQQQQEQLES